MGLGKPHHPANFEVVIFSRCRNIKGDAKIWGAPLAQSHAHFSSVCDYVMGLGKPNLNTKFEVASFSRCRNIKGGPQNFRELP